MPSIGVFGRIRPELGNRLKTASTADAEAEGISVLGQNEPQQVLVRNLEFSLDWVFDRDASQEEVFDVVAKERVARVTSCFNVSIVAYGQTGSGKTYTMFARVLAPNL